MRILIMQSFSGFPGGTDASERHFVEGDIVDDLPDDFARLIIAKGHAASDESPDAKASTNSKDGVE